MSEQFINYPQTQQDVLIKQTLKLDFFIDLKVNFDDIQKILSLINIITLMVAENLNIPLPELYLIRMETDSILCSFETQEDFLNTLKALIIDITKIKHSDRIPSDHYLVPMFDSTLKLFKDGVLNNSKYLLLEEIELNDTAQLKEHLFNWVQKITAINGKLIEERTIFDSKEEVIETYNKNKQEGLINSVFSDIILDDINLSYANCKDSNFSKAKLIKANLEGAVLENTDFSDASLLGANLSSTNLKRALLINTQLIDSNFSEAKLNKSNLAKAYLIGAILRRCDLTDANLEGAILARADAYGAIFRNCNIQHANLVGINAVEANFSGVNLSNSDLSISRLQGVILEKANLENTKLLEANMISIVQFTDANFTGSDWWNASSISPELLQFLRYVFPCTLNEEERRENYKLNYGKMPSEKVISRQNAFLGIKKEEQPEVEAEKKEEDNYINEDGTLSPEYVERLAKELWDEPI